MNSLGIRTDFYKKWPISFSHFGNARLFCLDMSCIFILKDFFDFIWCQERSFRTKLPHITQEIWIQ